jgi:UDP-N-acetylmuramoyl-L-alanyl-D-glutamate--2,6-diaminopimelate ligase
MKFRELLKDVEILECTADLDMEVKDVKSDSRTVEKGDVFAALVGEEADGHNYIGAAVEKGACAVVCQLRPETDVPFVRVRDSRLAMAYMSRSYFGDPAARMTMIGVTGTNGKTTSTLLMKHVLETVCGAKVGLIGTNSNWIGDQEFPTERTTPDAYELQQLFRQMADAGCTHVVMEVSSHALSLSRVAGVQFAVGLFTNLTQDHLDFHGTMESYAEAKAALFSQCDRGIVNLDDKWAPYMLERAKCPMMTYSVESMDGDLIANDLRTSASQVRFVALHGTDGLARVTLHIPGKFSVYNALGVLAMGLSLGLELGQCAEALKTAHGVKGRVEVVPTDGDYTILIDYAHTPDALENVLRSMQEVTEGRVVVMFGCGGDRDRTKRPIMGAIAAKYADYVVITSDNPRTEDPKAIINDIIQGLAGTRTPHTVIPDRREAIAYAIDNHQPGDVIILAGKGHETYQIIGRTKHHMDEREIVAEHLAARAAKA